MRWRLANFPADVAVADMEDEIDTFTLEAFQVARLYGEMEVLAELSRASDDGTDRRCPVN